MRAIRTSMLVVATALVAVIGLAGCSGGSNDDEFANYNSVGEPDLVYINAETGKITKYIDVERDGEELIETILFEEDYSKKDTEIQYGIDGMIASPMDDAYALSTTITVEGKSYPMATSLHWQWMPMELSAQITLYNERVATSDGPPAPLEARSIASMVRGSIWSNIRTAIDEGTLPTAQFATTGYSVTTTDDRIVEGWKAGLPAWQALQSTQEMPVTSEEYYYSFLCATYDVALTNEQALLDAAMQLPDAEYVQFSVPTASKSLTVETAQPCSIEPTESGSTKDSNQSPDQPANDNPVPPPGG